MSGDQLLDELRPTAFSVAYRMLGSVSEAEDVVQEALLRVHRVLEEGEHITSPRAYVGTVAARLAIDGLRSARAGGRPTSASGSRSRCSPAPPTTHPARRSWPTRCRSPS